MAIFKVSDQVGYNQKDVKLVNRAVIFRTIRESGKISRAELAKISHLNPSTVTHITRELLKQGLIEEMGFGETKVGRPTSLLRVRSEHGYIIAVRLSRHNITGILTNLDIQNTFRHTVTSSSLSHPIDISLPALLNLIQSLIRESGVAREKILGIGICTPGPLDATQGVLISPPNFPGWPSTPLKQIVHDATGFPTFLDNDANAAALAEKWFGGGKEWEHFVYVLIEDGIGGGLVINGDIYRGEHDVAGEIGHITIDLNGPRCDCGNIGCFELYASPKSAEEYVCKEIASGRHSLALDLAGNDFESVQFEHIIQAALKQDPVALEALAAIKTALAAGLINVINTFDPETVVIGGRMGKAVEIILDDLQREVSRRLMPRGEHDVLITLSELQEDAPLIGAFSLVLRELFQNPEFHKI